MNWSLLIPCAMTVVGLVMATIFGIRKYLQPETRGLDTFMCLYCLALATAGLYNLISGAWMR